MKCRSAINAASLWSRDFFWRGRSFHWRVPRNRTRFLQFTANCNAYFDSQALGDFESSLTPLGAPIEFRQTHKELRGGMIFRAYDVVFPSADLELTTYQMPDGKIERFIVTPAE